MRWIKLTLGLVLIAALGAAIFLVARFVQQVLIQGTAALDEAGNALISATEEAWTAPSRTREGGDWADAAYDGVLPAQAGWEDESGNEVFDDEEDLSDVPVDALPEDLVGTGGDNIVDIVEEPEEPESDETSPTEAE